MQKELSGRAGKLFSERVICKRGGGGQTRMAGIGRPERRGGSKRVPNTIVAKKDSFSAGKMSNID